MRFEFATATRVVFGPDTLHEVGPAAASMGRMVLLVTGRSPDGTAPLLDILAAQGLGVVTFSVTEEPTVESVERAARSAREAGCDMVVGFGGGSAIDTGKAVAALLTNGGTPWDYLELVGRGQALTEPAAPWIAIPTTAGTGAEVTRNAVLKCPDHHVKVSMRSPLMLPRLAVVDPKLTHSMPPAVTASTGMDALTQVLEPYVSKRANPLTDAVCREGMHRASRSLRRAYENGRDSAAREDMALASLFGGLALTNAGLGAVHGFAGPLGGLVPGPHGAICAALLPQVMAANVRVLQTRSPDEQCLRRYDEIARILTGDSLATAADGIAWVEELCQALQVPPLRTYGLTERDLPSVVEQAAVTSSMRSNPVQLSPTEMREILEQAL